MNLAKIADAYGPELGAIGSLLFVAFVELLCILYPDDAGVSYVAECAAGSFLAIAMLVLLSIVQAEREN